MIALDWLVVLRPTENGMKAGTPKPAIVWFSDPKQARRTVAISGDRDADVWWTTRQDSGAFDNYAAPVGAKEG